MSPSIRISSVRVPLGFITAGLLSLLAGMVCIFAYPEILATYHYNQRVISVTHLFTLGWICSVIMGAMYQLVPVALETKLHSEQLAYWHFGLHLVGFAGMVSMFWAWNIEGVASFGLALTGGVILFAYNIARTLARIPHWNVIAVGIASSLVWLCVTVIAGLLLAASKLWPLSSFDPIQQMHAHAHAGGLGFFTMMIVAVTYRLIPMFVLSEVQNQRRAWASIILLNSGVAGVVITVLLGTPIKFLFAMVVICSLALYSCELFAMLRARKRRVFDWGIKYFLTAIALLIPVSLLALPLSWQGLPLNAFTGQMENVYGLLALLGVVTLAILGMLYKVVPFLVWYSSYSREIGRSKVPALADLYSVQLQKIGYWTFLAGAAVTVPGTLLGHAQCVQRGAGIWTISILIFAWNFAKICLHLVRPKTEPLLFQTALKGAL